MAKFQYDDSFNKNPIPLHFTEGTSAEEPISDVTAFSWGKFFYENVLNFNNKHFYAAIGIDPFAKAEDGKYLLHIADDGTLKELIPDDRRKDCLDDPDFCRQMIKLSQQGRLFVRSPGSDSCRQVKTTLGAYGRWKIQVTHAAAKLSFKQPVYPQAPAFWKYLLYPFFAGQIRKYNEDVKAFENEYGTQIAGNKDYIENLQKSLRQLDAMEGLDKRVLSREIEQRTDAQDAWEERSRDDDHHNVMKAQKFYDRDIEIYEMDLAKLDRQKLLYEPIEALKFDSMDHLIQIASLNTKQGSSGYNYMDELKNMGGKNVKISSLSPQSRFSIATKCLQNNLRELNKYSVKDPEFRLLMGMNEALLEKFMTDDNPLYCDENKNIIDELYHRQVDLRAVTEAFSQMVDSKMDALKDCIKYDRLKDSGREIFRDDFSAAVLLELVETTENLRKVKGAADRNPLYQKIAQKSLSFVCNRIASSDAFSDMIKNSSVIEKVSILNDRDRMHELIEKIIAEPKFKEEMGDLHLNKILEEAKSLGLFGPRGMVNGYDAWQFEEYLKSMAAVDTTIDTVDMLRTKGTTCDSYFEYLTQILENQIAKPLLKKINPMDSEMKTAFLLYNKPIYECLSAGIRKYVSKHVNRDRVEAYLNKNFDAYDLSIEDFEKGLRMERNNIQNGALSDYMAKLSDYVPKAEKTTAQIEKEHQEIQSTFGGLVK